MNETVNNINNITDQSEQGNDLCMCNDEDIKSKYKENNNTIIGKFLSEKPILKNSRLKLVQHMVWSRRPQDFRIGTQNLQNHYGQPYGCEKAP